MPRNSKEDSHFFVATHLIFIAVENEQPRGKEHNFNLMELSFSPYDLMGK